jgi:hypothetical protein
MLAQFGGDRVGHDLAAVDLRRLSPVDRGVPAHLRIAVNSNKKVAGADPQLHDVFELGRGLFLLVHVFLSELPASVYRQLRAQGRFAGRGYAIRPH